MTRDEAKQLLSIIQAYAEGKTIQTRYSLGENMEITWKDVEYPAFTSAEYYRIKPESTYRPFKDAEECWNEMQKHQPFGWVKKKDDENMLFSIGAFDMSEKGGTALFFLKEWHSLYDIFDKYIFADGKPFGIKEE